MAKRLIEIENQMVIERPDKRNQLITIVKPTLVCKCGCNRRIETVSLRTHEGEPLFEKECWMRISISEKFIEEVEAS